MAHLCLSSILTSAFSRTTPGSASAVGARRLKEVGAEGEAEGPRGEVTGQDSRCRNGVPDGVHAAPVLDPAVHRQVGLVHDADEAGAARAPPREPHHEAVVGQAQDGAAH